eukprot:CAMPEP_0184330702 /NCGR_PEP_ID=MMETSP1049-20130417/144823_1 /TAXON_ID=77928 /ORGANISM="Proteomonas sulcata, Strain CCMP704" /LENGTH=76 /DNA_ID=CAMNT_0026653155 /DNA_START=591 /DNA_END=821 /DNA_ORIENTATION=+
MITGDGADGAPCAGLGATIVTPSAPCADLDGVIATLSAASAGLGEVIAVPACIAEPATSTCCGMVADCNCAGVPGD